MRAVVWSDYICPWCYLGRDRTALLETLDISVETRPFELHPELSSDPIPLTRRYSRIAAACADIGLPFNPPGFAVSSRRALETVAVVRQLQPDAVDALDAALFTAYFVDGRSIAERDVLDELVTTAGADADAVRAQVEAGAGRAVVTAERDAAYDAGVSGTPTWVIDGRLVIPGVQDRDYYVQMVSRLRARTS
jgi:predicted DsbA family dithiol-disulfide isomerase